MSSRPDDIFSAIKTGEDSYVLEWLSRPGTIDLNQGDGHGFTPLIWASYYGRVNMVDKFLAKGAISDVPNMGGDTALHQAASCNHYDIVIRLLNNGANVNVSNEHGNTPLHYACFWNHVRVCQVLVKQGALVTKANKFGDTPLSRARGELVSGLKQFAKDCGQDLASIPYNAQLEQRTKADMQMKNKNLEVDLPNIAKSLKLGSTPSGDTWKASWSGHTVITKKLKILEVNKDKFRYFLQEAGRLRVFGHQHILPVVGIVNDIHNPHVMTPFCSRGSLFEVLHPDGNNLDQAVRLNIVKGISRGMQYLHGLDPLIPRLALNSHHVIIDDSFNALVSLGDARFSFQDNQRIYYPQWVAPEVLRLGWDGINHRLADMYSFAIIMWECATGLIPFQDIPHQDPIIIGRTIVIKEKRLDIATVPNQHLAKLIDIAWNFVPAKRPPFDRVSPIIEKLK